nr:alpha-mann_mid [uncultured Roseburia sp.]
MLMDLEQLSVIAAGKGIPYPKDKLDSMWKTVLRNQFHDILPGSAIEEVYEVTKAEYGQIKKKEQPLLPNVWRPSAEKKKQSAYLIRWALHAARWLR